LKPYDGSVFIQSERRNAGFKPNDVPLEGVNFSFDDNALIVLGRRVMEGGPGVPSDALPRVEGAWRAGHIALPSRSGRGVRMVVPGSRHYVQIDRPDAVIDASRRVVPALRGGG
jgi:hypothetical protein